MIDYEKLKPILQRYKQDFAENFNGENDEKYKWEAVKWFQDHWDIDAEDFGSMFKLATDKTANLLASGYAYPRGMIQEFAGADTEATREMFRKLFDESEDLAVRIETFKSDADEIRAKYSDGNWHKHFQNTNAISTYLWLRYPDKYYIYKYDLYKAAATELGADYMPKRDGSVESMLGGYRMYDEICKALKDDPDVVAMVKNAITTDCYSDPELKTATMDFGHYLAKYYSSEQEVKWFPQDYSPELTVNDWIELLKDMAVKQHVNSCQ